MIRIDSKIDGMPLQIIHQFTDFDQWKQTEDGFSRADLVNDDQVLQLAALHMPYGKTFRAHKHITADKPVNTTQEAWVVIAGEVEVFCYDLDDSLRNTCTLTRGDCVVTLRGGHNYLIKEQGTLVYEFKTGPYLGQEKDKVFI